MFLGGKEGGISPAMNDDDNNKHLLLLKNGIKS